MTKKIRVLEIVFDAEIRDYEIPAFRSAIIEKAGRENVLFHNHLKGNGFLYKYPLIQYKRIGKRPSIVCVEQGVDEIHNYFEKRNWDINISGRWLDMKILKLNLNQFTIQVWNHQFEYALKNWIALNQKNYKEFTEMDSMSAKIKFLEHILIGNILSFAKGIEWTIESPVKVTIVDLKLLHKVKLKGNDVIGFNIDFRTNVFLPNHIGLGKSSSLGFGMVFQMLKGKENTDKDN